MLSQVLFPVDTVNEQHEHAPQIRDFAVSLMTSFSSFFRFFNRATAYTIERLFTRNTQKDVVPDKGNALLEVAMTIFNI